MSMNHFMFLVTLDTVADGTNAIYWPNSVKHSNKMLPTDGENVLPCVLSRLRDSGAILCMILLLFGSLTGKVFLKDCLSWKVNGNPAPNNLLASDWLKTSFMQTPGGEATSGKKMDRFAWTDGVLQEEEQLVVKQSGVKLYDGNAKVV